MGALSEVVEIVQNKGEVLNTKQEDNTRQDKIKKWEKKGKDFLNETKKKRGEEGGGKETSPSFRKSEDQSTADS